MAFKAGNVAGFVTFLSINAARAQAWDAFPVHDFYRRNFISSAYTLVYE